MDETALKNFLQAGGKIKVIAPHDDRFASHRTRWHFGGVNNYRKQYVRKSSVGFANRGPRATAPGGGIEPGSPYKSRPNPKKTAMPGSTGNGGWYTSIEPQHG